MPRLAQKNIQRSKFGLSVTEQTVQELTGKVGALGEEKEKALIDAQREVDTLKQRIEALEGKRARQEKEAMALSLASGIVTKAIAEATPYTEKSGQMNVAKRQKLITGLKEFIKANSSEIDFAEPRRSEYVTAMSQALKKFMEREMSSKGGYAHVHFTLRDDQILQEGILHTDIRDVLIAAIKDVRESFAPSAPPVIFTNSPESSVVAEKAIDSQVEVLASGTSAREYPSVEGSDVPAFVFKP